MMQKATFGAGCFWGVEETFRKTDGVTDTAVGFMGGDIENSSYEKVCTGKTGHIEVVDLSFDPSEVSFEQLLDVFWSTHNPTTPNRQGPDVGEQYSSVIFYHTPEQKITAESSKDALESSKTFSDPVVTKILPAGEFYRAEEYHQRYLQKRGKNTC